MRIERLCIVGTGLLGGSIGLACRKILKSTFISAYDHNPEGVQKAIELGIIQEGFETPEDAVAGADLVILCTPVGTFREILAKISGSLKTGAIVTDVGSTKRSIVKLARQLLPSAVRLVGSHPMAGGEKKGIEHARADLLTGAKCILTPSETSDPKAVKTVESFWQALEMQTVHLSPEEHDRLVCDVSHLPHAVAAAMVRMQSPEAMEVAARGFADSTRIAAGDAAIWRDILQDNRDNLKNGIHRLQEQLQVLSTALDANDETGIRDWLTDASEARKKFGQRPANESSGE